MEKTQDNSTGPAETVVGPSVKIQGDFNSEGNIRIEGHVNGTVKTTQNVYAGESSKITANVTAGNCTVAGEILGNIKVTGSLILESTARISGDISCAILRVEDGAQFSGKCSMSGIDKSGKKQNEPEPEN